MEAKRRREIILIAGLLAVSILSFGMVRFFQNATTKNAVVVITVDGKEYGRYSITEEKKIRIPGKEGNENVVLIHKGYVKMKTASCPDKICVHHRKISKNGESIVCLPNKVVVEIQSQTEDEVDSTT